MVNASRVILKETSSDPKPAGPIQRGFDSAALRFFHLTALQSLLPSSLVPGLLYLAQSTRAAR
jgi:hypothetical protein